MDVKTLSEREREKLTRKLVQVCAAMQHPDLMPAPAVPVDACACAASPLQRLLLPAPVPAKEAHCRCLHRTLLQDLILRCTLSSTRARRPSSRWWARRRTSPRPTCTRAQPRWPGALPSAFNAADLRCIELQYGEHEAHDGGAPDMQVL